MFGFEDPGIVTGLRDHQARAWALQQWERWYFLDEDPQARHAKREALKQMKFKGVGDVGAAIRTTEVLNCVMTGLVAATACGHVVPAYWGIPLGAMVCVRWATPHGCV